MDLISTFFIGLVCGAVVGIFIMAIIVAASNSNDNCYDEDGVNIEILDKTEDGRYLAKIFYRGRKDTD